LQYNILITDFFCCCKR